MDFFIVKLFHILLLLPFTMSCKKNDSSEISNSIDSGNSSSFNLDDNSIDNTACNSDIDCNFDPNLSNISNNCDSIDCNLEDNIRDCTNNNCDSIDDNFDLNKRMKRMLRSLSLQMCTFCLIRSM